ncbi:MAG: O-antigen ligase family protein [Armatimonadota bacterium]
MLNAVLLPLAVVIAVALVMIASYGGRDIAIFVSVLTVLTIAAFASLELGVMALIVAACFDGFLKGLSPGWHTQLLKDYLLGVCLLRWGWLSVLGHPRRSVRHPLSVMILLFMGWALLQLLNARNPSLMLALTNLRTWVIWLPVFFLAYDYLASRAQVERFLRFIFPLMTPLAIYGIVQYQVGLDHLFALGEGFDVYQRSQYATATYELEVRPPSTMISAHTFAAACVMAICLGIGAVAYFRGRRHIQLPIVVSMPLLGVALLVTAVRNAYASVAVGVLVLLVLLRRPGLVLVTAAVGAVAFYGANELTGGRTFERLNTIISQPEYTRARIVGPWGTALYWAGRRPLGAGYSSGAGRGRLLENLEPEAVRPEQRTVWAENEYARALIELGIPGFLLFCAMLAGVIWHSLQAYRRCEDPRDRWLIAGIIAAEASLLARLLVGSALYGWPEAIMFWCYVAIALRLPEIEAQEQGQVLTPLMATRPQQALASR